MIVKKVANRGRRRRDRVKQDIETVERKQKF